MLLINNESILVNLVLVDCAKTYACNDSTVVSEPKDCWFNNSEGKSALDECCLLKSERKQRNKRKLLGLAQENQEAVKECYKEYIGMVKVYYEEAQRSKHGRPGESVVGTSSRTAWKREPQAFAGMRSVEIVDTPEDGTPKGTS
ncbi:hypothetical protein Tco_0472106 [Tanacetum coccineum]